MIQCTNTQSFEEGENYAPTMSMKNLDLFQTLEYDMNLFVYDIILFVSGFKFHDILVMLVVVLINFGVKNQVPRVSFKILLGISCHSTILDMISP